MINYKCDVCKEPCGELICVYKRLDGVVYSVIVNQVNKLYIESHICKECRDRVLSEGVTVVRDGNQFKEG